VINPIDTYPIRCRSTALQRVSKESARRPAFQRLIPILLLWGLLQLPTGCASTNYLSVRKVPRNPLNSVLQLTSYDGPRPSERTEQLLRRFDLAEQQKKSSPVVLASLEQEIANHPDPEKIYSFAELAYIDGRRAYDAGKKAEAVELFSSAVAYAYLYIFDPKLDRFRNPYDPQFRQACDLYNAALEAGLRILKEHGKLKPGDPQIVQTVKERLHLSIEVHGPWHADDIQDLDFVSGYEIQGLTNHYRTFGLGVPLIAIRKRHRDQDPAESYYPEGITFPVTAFLRVDRPSTEVAQASGAPAVMHCVLELHDSLTTDHLQVGDRLVPLETDLTIPLGYFLDSPSFKSSKIATWGLFRPGRTQRLEGIYMVEPYDPRKIPVLLVHGLWSSPTTWMEMFNDLRGLPEIRDNFQFWFYLYPTGQPFWISAAQLREELEQLQQQLDPAWRSRAFREMVLVGHSMGGLVSRLQVMESGQDFWHAVSSRDFAELKTDPETRERLRRVLFFHPNPAIRRVVTIGTPHQGSDFANDATRYLGRKLIQLPKRMVQSSQKLVWDNPGFFRNTDLLTTTTSIDSLSPESPIFADMKRVPAAPWVHMHNIVGVIPEKGLLGRITESGDGIVAFESAHLEEVDSELTVESDHVNIHRHPRSVLEVRRILLRHLAEPNSTDWDQVGSESVAEPMAAQRPHSARTTWQRDFEHLAAE